MTKGQYFSYFSPVGLSASRLLTEQWKIRSIRPNMLWCTRTFLCPCCGNGRPGTVEVLKAAANHKGASVCEILQNCVIFNDGTHESVYNKEGRAKNAIYLEHGKPMLFGENKEFGLMQEGFGLKVVKLGENGITEKDILIQMHIAWITRCS